MTWQVPRIWEDGDVWIIGGGPSIPKQFGIPDKVVRNVIKGSSSPDVYSPYMSALHDKHVIGVNIAYQLGDWIDMVFFGDGGFFLKYQKKLAEFPGLKVSCSPKTNDTPWVKYLFRDKKHPRGISSNPRSVSWNGNSGAAAVSVAANAGAKRIILLGFDMKIGGNNTQHWHDSYGRGAITEERRLKKMPFHKHLRGFPAIAEDAKKRKIEILNASPDSAIQCFRKVLVKDLL